MVSKRNIHLLKEIFQFRKWKAAVILIFLLIYCADIVLTLEMQSVLDSYEPRLSPAYFNMLKAIKYEIIYEYYNDIPNAQEMNRTAKEYEGIYDAISSEATLEIQPLKDAREPLFTIDKFLF